MSQRTVMIFPELTNIGIIDEIRRKYDPLAELVRPHITLVFPFEDDMDNAKLDNYISAKITNIEPFRLKLHGVTRESDDSCYYIYLNVTDGYEEISALHNNLYDGELNKYLKNILNKPHITLGSFNKISELEEAWNEVKNLDETFEYIVNGLSVEEIGSCGESNIILQKKW